MQKQFKIGEYAVGGIIKISKSQDVITVQALDYNSKKCIMEERFHTERPGFIAQIDHFLNDLTTSYYADKIINYIKTKLI
jgi:hypothetical protein